MPILLFIGFGIPDRENFIRKTKYFYCFSLKNQHYGKPDLIWKLDFLASGGTSGSFKFVCITNLAPSSTNTTPKPNEKQVLVGLLEKRINCFSL
ncbi:hypothetical protein RCL_jg14973.t1 [Rhizophagus clarus]|uniref:Uncharacterized protein n=1 Tax=Rhizophagus clarus TaxID=94130 RepID=A0A8H3M7H9_9GLOM|nr:hypothetical protein RCL_jg14973.t1 [Rhizophagus clarus]